MATPTVTVTGATGGLFLVTDHEGVTKRIPITSISAITDSSNGSVYRLEIHYAHGEMILIFANATEVNTFLTAIDAQY